MLIARANPWICLGLAFAWLALGVFSAPPQGFVPSLSQIAASQAMSFFLLLSATFLTAAMTPQDQDAKQSAFAHGIQILRIDLLRVRQGASFVRAVRMGVIAGAAMIVLSGIISAAVDFVARSAGGELELQPIVGILRRSAWPSRAALVASVVVLSPIFEELFFRYAMESSLEGALRCRARAVAYAAILFAGMHGTLSVFPSLVLVAVSCSYIYRRAGNIAAPIAAHMVFNLASISAIFLGGVE